MNVSRSGLILGSMAYAVLTLSLVGCGRPTVASPTPDHENAVALRAMLLRGSAAGGQDAGEGAAPTASGWATLRGRFVFEDTAPSLPPLDKKGNAECVAPVPDESIVVGADGGLRHAVIYLRGKNLPVHPDYDATAGDSILLDNIKCRFEPHVLMMRTTQTLLIKNSDPFGHNTNLYCKDNPRANTSVPSRTELIQSLPNEEGRPVKVGCNIHPWMGGWLFVRANPYGAVSNASGEFVLANVPAGLELEFQLWHEKKSKGLSGVKIDDPNVKLDRRGRLTLKLEPDEERVLQITVPAAALN